MTIDVHSVELLNRYFPVLVSFRTADLKYLRSLHQLAEEYMVDNLMQRVEDDIYCQSFCLQDPYHAADILETVDAVKFSKQFRVKEVRENCARNFRGNLTNVEEFEN